MAQTFRTLAILLTLAILITIGLGFWSFFTPGKPKDKDEFLIHFVCGLGTAVGILLVHCLIFIYFLGTGRWVKEVTIAYGMPDEPWHKQTRELKRATFPPALFSMLIGIAAAAAGAGAQLQSWPREVHMTLGLLTLAINLWAFRIELRNVAINAGVIDGVMNEVDRIRAERGMVSNDEALREDETPVRPLISCASQEEPSRQPPKKPSLFFGGLVGYLTAMLIGTAVCWFLAARSGEFDNQPVFTLLTSLGALGAFEGYRFAVRRRKRLGVNEPSDEWREFFGSWTFYFLGALVIVGSAAISLAESLLFDLTYGAPWLQNR